MLTVALQALLLIYLLALCAWRVSLSKNDVSIADTAWPLYILIGGAAYALAASQTGPRACCGHTGSVVGGAIDDSHYLAPQGETRRTPLQGHSHSQRAPFSMEKSGASVRFAGHAGVGRLLARGRSCREFATMALA